MLWSCCFPRQALRRIGSVAEQPLEHHLRAVLHGQRERRRTPGDGVEISATVARAAIQTHFLDAQFEGWQRRVLADVLGQHLVHSHAGVHRTLLRMRAAEEDGGGTGVIRAGIGADAAGRRMGQVAEHTNAVAQFLERLQAFREFEPGAFLRGRPFVHGGAVRDVDTAESGLGDRGGLGQRRLRGNHGVQQRQRERDTHAAQKRSPAANAFW